MHWYLLVRVEPDRQARAGRLRLRNPPGRSQFFNFTGYSRLPNAEEPVVSASGGAAHFLTQFLQEPFSKMVD